MWPARVGRSRFFRWMIRTTSGNSRIFAWSRRFTVWPSTRGPTGSMRRPNRKAVGWRRRCLCSKPSGWRERLGAGGEVQRCIVLVGLLFAVGTAAPAAAYRPFISTDAAVADPKAVEIELGYFNVEHTRGENMFTTPSVVLNYGLVRNWEAVAEFGIVSSPGFDVTDPALSLKGVLREGILQEKPGLSV